MTKWQRTSRDVKKERLTVRGHARGKLSCVVAGRGLNRKRGAGWSVQRSDTDDQRGARYERVTVDPQVVDPVRPVGNEVVRAAVHGEVVALADCTRYNQEHRVTQDTTGTAHERTCLKGVSTNNLGIHHRAIRLPFVRHKQHDRSDEGRGRDVHVDGRVRLRGVTELEVRHGVRRHRGELGTPRHKQSQNNANAATFNNKDYLRPAVNQLDSVVPHSHQEGVRRRAQETRHTDVEPAHRTAENAVHGRRQRQRLVVQRNHPPLRSCRRERSNVTLQGQREGGELTM